MQAFRIIIKDGVEDTFRSIPMVTRTTRKFDAPLCRRRFALYIESIDGSGMWGDRAK
jgi:hypothetical protein